MNNFDFTPLSIDSETDFLPYQEYCRFGDITFRALYAWQPIFKCKYTAGKDYLLISELSLSGEQMYILLRKPDTNLEAILSAMMQEKCRIQLEFVFESELPDFKEAAGKLGLQCHTAWDEQFSDYIYRSEDYCRLSGTRQKSLRGDINSLLKQIPDIRIESFRDKYAPMCLEIFDKWCYGRNCENCVYGCERKVFERFLQTYQEPICFGALAFSGDTPLSFLMGETLPGGVLDIHFQKNAIRQRGLTYWLSREFAMQHPESRWIDLEEDMGIIGLRLDKQRLHPYDMKKKYTVILEPKRSEHSI